MRERIRRVRREQGLTQVELAAVLGVTVRTIQAWEAGQEPQARSLRLLAALSGRPVAWFYETGVPA